ncbi:MAG TPA: bifunctional RNase H/acid phosphatase [Jatrophihabitans sp.]|nr:bifunctional RNase H/acid phosphatase [Jatrophihabitans sp.]
MTGGPAGARVVVEADGGSRGNPGPAGYGAVVRDAESGAVLAERMGYLGVATNNVAEYRGLIAGLAAAAELGAGEVTVRMDSKLVVEQMSGRWQVKHPAMRPLAAEARALAGRFERISYGWIPRAQNAAADRLANQAMDAGQVPAAAAEPTPASPSTAIESQNNNAAWIAAGSAATRLVLLRHGVTEYSVVKRFAGRSDLDLTADGVRQAEQAAGRIAELAGIEAIYSSPLLRTRHTAEIVGRRLGLPVTVEDGLIETDFGDWDGYTIDEISQRWPAELARWLADPAVAPPGGESLDAAGRRARQARDRILRQQAGHTVAVVSHVTPIKELVRLALDAPQAAVHRMYLAPAGISTIDYYAEGAVSLRGYNETAHLDG